MNQGKEMMEMKLQNANDDKSMLFIKNENEIHEILTKLKLKNEIKVRERKQTPTGRIQLHAFILKEPFKKLEYKLNKTSMTGYEEFECEKKDASGSASVVDNVLLPKAFLSNQIGLRQNRLKIKTNRSGETLLCAITRRTELIWHKLRIQTAEATMKLKQRQMSQKRKITKIDYMEYMIEKFGSRAAIHYPDDEMLALHTTYVLKEECKDAQSLCEQVEKRIRSSLEDKEGKNFAYLNWKCNVIQSDEPVNVPKIIKGVTNKGIMPADAFIKSLISQIPIQIARTTDNKLNLMYNGEDNPSQYIQATDCFSLCETIRFGAYDGLIKAWHGDIIVVTSMGKQSTGKSYLLNHLFGTKFDISGGRCTDGAWLSVKIVDSTLYIVCDFEGLGSLERSEQEDTLLATFNAAISNCTIFKCDNRFDRAVEEMFNKFQ
eukprot:374885_1